MVMSLPKMIPSHKVWEVWPIRKVKQPLLWCIEMNILRPDGVTAYRIRTAFITRKMAEDIAEDLNSGTDPVKLGLTTIVT